jgi:hypothetical protein
MATISFLAGEGSEAIHHLQGSGLGFYGTTFGSSVQIGSFQDSTFVTNADGTTQAQDADNIKYVSSHSGIYKGNPTTKSVLLVPSSRSSLNIRFDHTSAVNVQNAQLRVYDRENINFPASGVRTMIAEMSNPVNTFPTTDAGSGDALWWGDDERYAYTNKNGVVFVGGANGDARINSTSGGTLETVGGTGTIVPLMDNPGSGGRLIGDDDTFLGKNSRTTSTMFGGTGVDMRHDWFLSLSASPTSIGSKTKYGLYFSLEYL